MQQHYRCPGHLCRMDQLYRRLPGNRAWRGLAVALVLALNALFSGGAMAQSRQVSLDSLEATPEHQQAVAGIVQLMQRYHYKRVKVDDTLSEQIFDRYLELSLIHI